MFYKNVPLDGYCTDTLYSYDMIFVCNVLAISNETGRGEEHLLILKDDMQWHAMTWGFAFGGKILRLNDPNHASADIPTGGGRRRRQGANCKEGDLSHLPLTRLIVLVFNFCPLIQLEVVASWVFFWKLYVGCTQHRWTPYTNYCISNKVKTKWYPMTNEYNELYNQSILYFDFWAFVCFCKGKTS